MGRGPVAIVSLCLALAVGVQPAVARKVLNPTDALGASLTSVLADFGDGTMHFAAPLSTPAISGAHVDAAGAIDVPLGGVTLPKIPIPDQEGDTNTNPSYHYHLHDGTVSTFIDHDPTGAIDPFTGLATLTIQPHFRFDYTVDYHNNADANCVLGTYSCGTVKPTNCTAGDPTADPGHPIVFHLTTGTTSPPSGTTPVQGVAYDDLAGTLTLADNTFAVPAVVGDCANGAPDVFAPFLVAQINAAAHLPSPAGHNTLEFGLALTPILRRGVIASLTAAPASGTAPLTVSLDAAGTQAPAGGPSYAFDLGDGSFGAPSPTATTAVTLGPGTHTLRVRAIDADGDADVATTTVTVAAPAPAATTTAPPTVVPAATVTAPATPPPLTAASLLNLPVRATCARRRSLRITLRGVPGVSVRQVSVRVGRHDATTFSGARLRLPLRVAGLPRGAFSVSVVVTLTDGRRITTTRRYGRCPVSRRAR